MENRIKYFKMEDRLAKKRIENVKLRAEAIINNRLRHSEKLRTKDERQRMENMIIEENRRIFNENRKDSKNKKMVLETRILQRKINTVMNTRVASKKNDSLKDEQKEHELINKAVKIASKNLEDKLKKE